MNRNMGPRLAVLFLFLVLVSIATLSLLSCGLPPITDATITTSLNQDGRSGSNDIIFCFSLEDKTSQELQQIRETINSLPERIGTENVAFMIWEPQDDHRICVKMETHFDDPGEIEALLSILYMGGRGSPAFSIQVGDVQSTTFKTAWSVSMTFDEDQDASGGKWIVNMPARIKEITVEPGRESRNVDKLYSIEGRTVELTFPPEMESEFITVSVIAEESRVGSLITWPIIIGLACSIIFGMLGYFGGRILKRRRQSSE